MDMMNVAMITNRPDPVLVRATEKLSAKQLEKIDETAREFESVFISEMLKPMFEEVKTDHMFGGGQAEEIFRSLLLQEYGKSMAQNGGLGIADEVKTQMIRAQAENM